MELSDNQMVAIAKRLIVKHAFINPEVTTKSYFVGGTKEIFFRAVCFGNNSFDFPERSFLGHDVLLMNACPDDLK